MKERHNHIKPILSVMAVILTVVFFNIAFQAVANAAPPVVDAGLYHTVGLKSDGTVVAGGDDSYDQRNVSSWTDIVHVSAGGDHTVGVKSDGTVVAVGYNRFGQCDVSSWTDIIQVSAGRYHTVGLKSDGTVMAVGDNYYGQCNVAGWDLQPDFVDVPPEHWAEDHIYAIFDAGITTGCSTNPLKYCPQANVTRAQMAAFIVRAVEGEPVANYCSTGSPFSDVNSNHWACRYIKRLYELRITTGCGGSNYCPNDPVTRAQMAVFLARAFLGMP